MSASNRVGKVVMIIALIALVLSFLGGSTNAQPVMTIPPMPAYAPSAVAANDSEEWELYNQEAYYDYASEFTAIYNAVNFKRAKNGRSMVQSSNGGSFKFIKKGSN